MPVIRCFRCQSNKPHTNCGNAYEETVTQVGEDEFEPGDPDVTSFFKCDQCGMLSVWTMYREHVFDKFKWVKTTLTPAYCMFRDISMSGKFEFKDLDITPELAANLQERLSETSKCLSINSWLAATILMGSILEGTLLAVCHKYPAEAGGAPNAPKVRNTNKPFDEWGLEALIEAAHSLGWIDITVRDYSKTIRRFRNFVHPQLQGADDKVNEDTCMISWHVLQLALGQLAKKLPRGRQARAPRAAGG